MLDGPLLSETWLDVSFFDELSSADRRLNPLIDWPGTITHPKEVLAQTTLWEAPSDNDVLFVNVLYQPALKLMYLSSCFLLCLRVDLSDKKKTVRKLTFCCYLNTVVPTNPQLGVDRTSDKQIAHNASLESRDTVPKSPTVLLPRPSTPNPTPEKVATQFKLYSLATFMSSLPRFTHTGLGIDIYFSFCSRLQLIFPFRSLRRL
ncbi:hypothetical protein VP01_3238g2 [Puccinia sorghi]|uniref:Uncharacterized protein n=1 Tax=Puccinia sorghi TaxID=27349 RepID=A0A0L6UY76_9BASI|nr:hypothetical protein VP01_3238g2 [Puccinia sorghi]